MNSILLSKMRKSSKKIYEINTAEECFFEEFERQAEKSGLGLKGFYLTRKHDGTISIDHVRCVAGYVDLRQEACRLRYFKTDFDFEDLDKLTLSQTIEHIPRWIDYVKCCMKERKDMGITEDDEDAYLANIDELNKQTMEKLGVETDKLSQPEIQQPTKKSKKGCAIVAGILGGIAVALIVLVIVLASTLGKNRPAGNSKSDTVHASQLAEVMKLDAQQEKAILEVFAECGIGEVQSVELFQKGEQRTSYYVEDDETIHYNGAESVIVVLIGNSSRSVKAIYYSDETIYEKSEVKAQLSDFYVPYELVEDYRVAAQMLINECLQYPQTAKYGAKSKWSVVVRDGLDVLQSTVKAKNAFGMESEMKFTVKFNRKTQAPVSVILDGEEMLKK